MLEPGGWGGISQSSQYLVAAYRDLGHDALFISATDYEVAAQLPRSARWPLVRWSRSRGVLRQTRLYRLLNVGNYFGALVRMWVRSRREPVDVLHLQGYYVPVLFWLTTLVMRPRVGTVVLSCHNAFLRKEGPRGGRLALFGVRRLLRTVDLAIVHSGGDVENLTDERLGKPRAVRVLPLGWHPVAVHERSAARQSEQVPGESFVALFLGYLRADKGLDLVAAALPRVPQEQQRALHLVVAGQDRGGLAPFLTMIREQPSECHVRVVNGYLTNDEMSRLLAAADVVLLPYRMVSDSGILRMAMAAARPVIAADVGGLAHVVRAANNGWLFGPDDAGALASALGKAIGEPLDSRLARGRAGYEYALHHYAWSAVARAHADAIALAGLRNP